MRASILLVDDELGVLNSLRRLLRRHDYDVEMFSDAGSALSRLRKTDFDVVISDYRMPAMSGVDFFCRAREIQAHAARVILSGEADRDAMLASINRAEVFRFLIKPWNDEHLLDTVSAAVDFRRQNDVAAMALDAYRIKNDIEHRRRLALERLERESPGITDVNWSVDNTIIIENE